MKEKLLRVFTNPEHVNKIGVVGLVISGILLYQGYIDGSLGLGLAAGVVLIPSLWATFSADELAAMAKKKLNG